MTSPGREGTPFQLEKAAPSAADREAISHFNLALQQGKHWYIALLEAISLWTSPEETVDGRHYRYLLANEAFDWLCLAERLCETADGRLPAEERDTLLFRGKPPLELSPRQFQELIGHAKYRAYLNYFYGVTVEEALLLAVEEDIYKEHCSGVFASRGNATEEACKRIYGASQTELLTQFRKERGLLSRRNMAFDELKEFTYWCFKFRLKHSPRPRVASDTKKALDMLQRLWSAQCPVSEPEAPEEEGPYVVQL